MKEIELASTSSAYSPMRPGWFESSFLSRRRGVRYPQEGVYASGNSLDGHTPGPVSSFGMVIQVYFEALNLSVISRDVNIAI